MPSLRVALGLLAPLLGSCAGLETIRAGECGNAVVEEGEDCDSFARLGMDCRAPGVEGECRFDCSSDAACDGVHSCGTDGICRAPSGVHETALEITDGAWLLAPGDFDGDGTLDVLAATPTKATLTYLGPGFTEEDTVDLTFGFAATALAAGHLGEDTPADIAYPEVAGVAVARGNDARTLDGTVFPTFVIPVPQSVAFAGDADPSFAGREALAVIDRPSAGAAVILISLTGISPQPSMMLTDEGALPPFAVAGETALDDVPAARLAPASPCDQYVLVYRQPRRVFLGTLCTRDGLLNGHEFSLAPGGPPVPSPLLEVDVDACPSDVDRAFIIDADADGDLDVVVTPRGPSGAEPCVVRGPFAFAESAPPAPPVPAQPAVAEPYPLFQLIEEAIDGARVTERVLAVDHLGTDRIPDFVTSYGVFMSRSSPCPTNTPGRPGGLAGTFHCATATPDSDPERGRYVSAATGDWNGNAIKDVVLSSGTPFWVRIRSGHATGTFADHLLETEGYPDALALGDLDGDGRDDIVLADRTCSRSGACVPDRTGDTLAVSFGTDVGLPDDSRALGALGAIQQILVDTIASPDGVLDAAEDINVVERDPLDGSLNFALLHGSPRRLLHAPLSLVLEQPEDPLSDYVFRPAAMAMGRLADRTTSGSYEPEAAASTQRLDLAVAAVAVSEAGAAPPEPAGLRLWLLASEGEAALASSRAWPGAPLEAWPELDPHAGFIAAADLDDDAADEVVYASGRGIAVADARAVTDADGTEHPVLVSEIVPVDLTITSSLLSPAAPAGFARRGSVSVPLVLEDVDADGQRDIVLLGRRETESAIVVLWNDRGRFDSGRAAALLLGGDGTSLAAGSIDGDADPEILIGIGERVVLVEVSDRELALGGPVPGLNAGAPATALSTVDVDADGVEDIVVGHEESFVIYRGLPANDGGTGAR